MIEPTPPDDGTWEAPRPRWWKPGDLADRGADAQRRSVAESSGVPAVLLSSSTARLTGDALPTAARPAWGRTLDLIRRYRREQFLLVILGPRGTGKTSLASSAVLRTCLGGDYAKYVVAHEYLTAIRESQSYSADLPESAVLKTWVQPILLAIDEAHEVPSTDRDEAAFRHLLGRRWDEGRATIIIANETPAAMKRRLGLSLADRVKERGGIIEFNWPSLRKPFKPEAP